MKTLVGILCILLSSCSEKTTAQSSDLLFAGVKSHYQSKESLKFSIRNNRDDMTYYYFISLDAYFNGAWHEALMDIDPKAPEKASIIKKITPLGKNEVKQAPLSFFSEPVDPKIAKKVRLKVEHYRFVLNYTNKTNSEDFKKIYSREFKVEL